jgi:threonine dehydrogenase-like Zn-dependent dehydrogenase
MNVEEGALVEPVAVALQITKIGEVKPNQTIVVFGCGPIGLLCQAVSKAYAAKKVIGADISQSRTEFARTFGGDDVFVPPVKPESVEDSAWSEEVARNMKEKFGLGEVLMWFLKLPVRRLVYRLVYIWCGRGVLMCKRAWVVR